MKLTSDEAYSLLIEGLENLENLKYIQHCRYVGNLAGLIAGELGLDADYAKTLGYLHDIGRKISHPLHIYEGYRFLKENGYEDYAFICLTHSFLNNDMECIGGELLPPDSKGYAVVKDFVEHATYTDYDRIIQLCDLLCLETGGTTLEERLADIDARKGTHKKSAYHRQVAFAQKQAIEKKLGHSVYDFYPLLNTK